MKFVDLGDVDGVPLGFSDVTALAGVGVIFTAIAEATADAYLDGCIVSGPGFKAI